MAETAPMRNSIFDGKLVEEICQLKGKEVVSGFIRLLLLLLLPLSLSLLMLLLLLCNLNG